MRCTRPLKAEVVIIGGGPAGMLAAATAAERGRDVLLLRLAAQCGSGVSRVYLRLAEGERELSAELRRMMAAML